MGNSGGRPKEPTITSSPNDHDEPARLEANGQWQEEGLQECGEQGCSLTARTPVLQVGGAPQFLGKGGEEENKLQKPISPLPWTTRQAARNGTRNLTFCSCYKEAVLSWGSSRERQCILPIKSWHNYFSSWSFSHSMEQCFCAGSWIYIGTTQIASTNGLLTSSPFFDSWCNSGIRSLKSSPRWFQNTVTFENY